jgi:hypothetical protein
MAEPRVRITIDGRVALTVEQIAERKGVKPKSVTGELTRYGIEHDAMLDGRKKIYLQHKIDSWWGNRVGKGANFRRKDAAKD